MPLVHQCRRGHRWRGADNCPECGAPIRGSMLVMFDPAPGQPKPQPAERDPDRLKGVDELAGQTGGAEADRKFEP
jgi:hypothetical protein